MCPVVGSWPGKDFTTKAAVVLETELTAAGIPHDLKVYPGPSTPSSTTSGARMTPPRRLTPGSGSWPSSPSTSGEDCRDRAKVWAVARVDCRGLTKPVAPDTASAVT
jgi:hypothetical protein